MTAGTPVELQEVIAAVSQVGFPIVMCLLFFFMFRAEIRGMSKSIAAMTKAVYRLKDAIDGGKYRSLDEEK